MLEIVPVRTEAQIEEARKLFLEYEKNIGVSLCFQNFEKEVRELPGDYAEPSGLLLLAIDDGSTAGCCALRPMEKGDYPKTAEMKRLFVRPTHRGRGIARNLVVAVIDRAVSLGYETIILDTLKSMTEAQALYIKMGFKEIPSYYPNPIEGTRYMKLDLRLARQ